MIDHDTRVQIFEKGRTGARDVPFTTGNPIMEEINEFAKSIRTGAKPETDGESALEALRLVRAAIASAQTGKKTAIQPG